MRTRDSASRVGRLTRRGCCCRKRRLADLCGLRRLRRHRGRLDRRLAHESARLVIVAAQRRAEVPETPAERATDFRQALRTEDQQRNHENEQKVRWLKDVADHVIKLTRSV